ncbi:MAG: hypothetical protein HQM04_10305 [Magnetococcales bacterium]|nr:hypothetical protein [Magnetococcales bacterium]MBF0115422.1 hypothetical protein [Magnetococcales bacterium]
MSEKCVAAGQAGWCPSHMAGGMAVGLWRAIGVAEPVGAFDWYRLLMLG